MQTGPVTTRLVCPAQDWPRGKVTSGPTAQPGSTLVRLEGLTERGRRAAGRGLPEGTVPRLDGLRLVDLRGAVRSAEVVDGPSAIRPCGLLHKGEAGA